MRPTPDRYAVIGNPIEQSKSPLIHSLFAQATGQEITYTKVLGEIDGFATQVDGLRAQGLKGMNVTAPFKLDAFSYATDLSESARAAGAVNALKFESGKVHAENFDGIGLVNDLQKNLGRPLAGRRVLLLGAGGATRGALLPIARQQPACIWVANRTLSKAQELVHGLAAYAQVQSQACGYGDLTQSFDVIINGTSASLFGELPAIPHDVFAPGCLAYEMVYGKGVTPFLQLARQADVQHLADGVGMLVEQAALAFEWWRGVRPDTADVIAQLRVPL
jgi:shikimate dehydrogenase